MNFIYRLLVSFTFLSSFCLLIFDILIGCSIVLDRNLVEGELGATFGLYILVFLFSVTGGLLIFYLITIPILMKKFQRTKRFMLTFAAAYVFAGAVFFLLNDISERFFYSPMSTFEGNESELFFNLLHWVKILGFALLFYLFYSIKEGNNSFYPLSVITLSTGPSIGFITLANLSLGVFYTLRENVLFISLFAILVPLGYIVYYFFFKNKEQDCDS